MKRKLMAWATGHTVQEPLTFGNRNRITRAWSKRVGRGEATGEVETSDQIRLCDSLLVYTLQYIQHT